MVQDNAFYQIDESPTPILITLNKKWENMLMIKNNDHSAYDISARSRFLILVSKNCFSSMSTMHVDYPVYYNKKLSST